jgi:hypothetical protein
MPYDILIKRTLTDEFLADVMTTMVESGYDSIYNWEGLDMRRIDRDNNGYPSHVEFYCDSPYLEGKRIAVLITPAKVAVAIQSILAGSVQLGYPKEYIERGVAEGDAGDIDATASDCIAQVIAFGEVVYG